MFCPKCGEKLKDGMVVCEKCGSIVPQPAGPESKAGSGLGVAALVLSILGFLTGFLLIGMVLDVVAIVLAVLVFRKAKRTPTKTGQAIAGAIVAGVSLVLCLILFLPSLLDDPAGDLYKEARVTITMAPIRWPSLRPMRCWTSTPAPGRRTRRRI